MADVEQMGYGFRTGPFPAEDEVVEGYDIHITDSDYIRFGNLASTGDAYMGWDGTNLNMVPAVDGTGILYLGHDTLAFSEVKIGTQANTAGSGPALSATHTAAFRVYGDDAGAAISSGTFARVGVFRHLLTYTAGNREQEAAGVVGQLVSKAGTNRHNMCGVMGSYEVNTSLTVDGQAWATDPWIQAAVIGRVGAGSAITTINANGILAGVAAMSNTTSFAANNGTFAAYFAGKWSGTLDWGYAFVFDSAAVGAGVYAAGGVAIKGLQFGTLSSTTPGSGFVLDATTTRTLEVNSDDNNTARATGTQGRAIFGRTMIYADNACEDWGVDGLSKVSAVAKTGNVSAGVVGRFESTGTCSTATGSGNTFVAGVMGRIGIGGAFTIGAGTKAACVLAFGNNQNATPFTNSGFVGFFATVTDVGTPQRLDYGLEIDSDVSVTGIYVGDTSQNGIQVVNSALTVGDSYSGVRVGVTAAAASNAYGVAAYFDTTLTGTQAGHVYGTGSWINTGSAYVGGSNLVVPFEGGIYDDSGTLTNTVMIFGSQHQAILGSAPGLLHAWRLNTTQTITSLIAAANAGSVGYAASAGTTSTKVGDIPFATIVGHGTVYMRLYDAAG